MVLGLRGKVVVQVVVALVLLLLLVLLVLVLVLLLLLLLLLGRGVGGVGGGGDGQSGAGRTEGADGGGRLAQDALVVHFGQHFRPQRGAVARLPLVLHRCNEFV